MNTMSLSAPEKKITLVSSDGEVFEVEEAVAAESPVIKRMIKDDCNDNVVPLPNITGKILSKLIEYCKRHVDAAAVIKTFETDFVKVDQATLLDLNLAADYLNIKSLMYLTSQTLTPSDSIKKSRFVSLEEKWLPGSLDSPFRDNVHRFILQYAKRKDYDMEGMPVWLITVEDKKREAYIPLYIVEEDVKRSATPFCNYCAPVGWGSHFLTKIKYHFIIPASDEWDNQLDEGTFDLEMHLLHGLIHSDGYGHLVCINGIEGGSELIPGREIMDFWEYICMSLGVRQISVCDMSRKNGMDLRLLYGVSCGGSWFGRWGYQFCRGTFGSTEEDYRTSIDNFSSLKLESVISVPKKGANAIINQIIHFYTSMGDDELVTLRDLFGFMVTLKSKHPAVSRRKEVRYKKYSDIVSYRYSRWTIRELEDAGSMIVGCLLERNGRMTRQEIWDELWIEFDYQELLSDALKLVNNVVVEHIEDMNGVGRKYIVRRGVNGVTRMQEYSIHDFKEDCLSAKPAIGQCVDHDIRYLYENLLCGYPGIEKSVNIILQSKHFVKDFSLGDNNMLRFNCRVSSWDQVFCGISVGEFRGATIGDIKVAVESEMREVYCIADNVEVTEVEVKEGSSSKRMEVWLNCRGLDTNSKLRFQEGEHKMVICDCGARDDDGEIMVLCYRCDGWRHMHCSGYKPLRRMVGLINCCGRPPFKGCKYAD